jgi:S-adenosylmethionine hydrolase
MAKLVTLLTDFGLRDGYPGVMHGVIHRIAPGATVVDLTHLVPPQDVREGSLAWSRAYTYFPEGTVHVAVVDPGVGTQRRPIAARADPYFFVCPDNGLLTSVLVDAEKSGQAVETVHLDQPRFWLPQVSPVFHGRDIFSPVAAYLANGVSLLDLGTSIADPVRLPPREPAARADGWLAEVISIDHFGNLTTNLEPHHLAEMPRVRVRIAGREIDGLVRTFGERPAGALVALFDSDNRLAICTVNGSAAHELGAAVGMLVEIVRSA